MYRRRRVGASIDNIIAPFKQPLKRIASTEEPLKIASTDEEPIKKSKLSPKRHERQLTTIPVKTEETISSQPEKLRFSVVWRKFSTKKNKTWEGDGFLIVDNGTGIFQNESGKELSRTSLKGGASEGDFIRMGVYEIEVDSIIKNQPNDVSTPVAPPPSIIRATRKVNTSPRFDPSAPGAIVMPRPSESDAKIIDVVVDPVIGSKLRPHQIEGLKFIYQCIMGMKLQSGRGALLADEMGLGKTLLTISLLWTLLKQNPIQGQPPVLKRVLIVCPVTLIANWQKEFKKWLGSDRIGVFVADSNARIRDFTGSRVYPVMIIGYEKVRTLVEDLRKVEFDIIICDEGHRLKTSNNKSAQALTSLNTEKKIILSGTPIQNDLGEFFIMIDFLNPGILGTYASFKKEFEIPIMRSRQPGALKKDVNNGKKKSEELSKLTQQFILRRTAKTLDNYLPPKTETVLFCYPTRAQLEKYKQVLNSSEMKQVIGSNDSSDHLKAITLLKKVCNSPLLVEESSSAHSLATSSGKCIVLMVFLKYLFNETDEKVVIVSGYTQTLDMIEKMIGSNGMSFLRLDGSTNQNKRQKLVDQFNRGDQKSSFVFLLSSRSGGVGINLVGASRLFLFDTDWNPSVDLQAMARIHRDGQKRPVFIYRLLICGAMDEKIYQRQITKQGLADRFMGENGKSKGDSFSSDSFSASELKELFVLQEETICNTHDILECKCGEKEGEVVEVVEVEEEEEEVEREVEDEGEDDEDDDDNDDLGGWVSAKTVDDEGIHVPESMKKKHRLEGLFDYNHIYPSGDLSNINDELLVKLLKKTKSISFIFTKSTILAN